MTTGRIRRLTNCLVVAINLWWMTRGKSWFANRRSLHFRGAIPHYSVFIERGDRLIRIEYVPPVEEGDTGRNFLVAFDGYFQVTIWRGHFVGRDKNFFRAFRKAMRETTS